jgi:hypothetical protein
MEIARLIREPETILADNRFSRKTATFRWRLDAVEMLLQAHKKPLRAIRRAMGFVILSELCKAGLA